MTYLALSAIFAPTILCPINPTIDDITTELKDSNSIYIVLSILTIVFYIDATECRNQLSDWSDMGV